VANTLSAFFNAVLLCYTLRRKLSRLGLRSLVNTLLVLVPTALFSGFIAWLLGSLWEKYFGHETLARRIGAVFVPGGLACLVYWGIALWAGIDAARDVLKLAEKRFHGAKVS
jgi:peptidoglycan biosynthesis protein MviN/MurJ (putative lipid II flippase)